MWASLPPGAPVAAAQVIHEGIKGSRLAVIPNVLTDEEIRTLRAGIDRVMGDQEKYTKSNNLYAPWIAVRMYPG